MLSKIFNIIYKNIVEDPFNKEMKALGFEPLYTAGPKAKILIIGQAPGLKAQLSKKIWHDASGDILRKWLGISDQQFYNPDIIALLPMDFYYPGKGKHGDLPPRKGFAEQWHPKLINQMPKIKLSILIGNYAQKYYLGLLRKNNLTETVRTYKDYLPSYFPLVHPSPLNFRWQAKNPWFKTDVLPELTKTINKILY